MNLIFVLLLCTYVQGGSNCVRVASYHNYAQCQQQAKALEASDTSIAYFIRTTRCVPANN